jgi:hypothetical protein
VSTGGLRRVEGRASTHGARRSASGSWGGLGATSVGIVRAQ